MTPARTAIWAHRVVADPEAAPLDRTAVVIENGMVLALEQRSSQPGDVVFPVGTLLPGLFDLHIHLGIESHPDDPIHRKEAVPVLALRCARNALITLQSGVTTCRDAGTRERASAYVRDAAVKGLLAAPRLLSAGRPLGAPEGHCNYMTVDVRDAADAEAPVQAEVGAGVDWIKLMVTGGIVPPSRGVQLRPESVHAAVAAAHRRGVRAMAHSETAEGARLCVDAGVDTIEHGVDIDEDTLQAMAEGQLTLVPTLMAFAEIVEGHNPALAPATLDLARAA
jgi:imidazolonepropionase-like amidohydrolase